MFSLLLPSIGKTIPLLDQSHVVEGTPWQRVSIALDKPPAELCFSVAGRVRIGLVSIVKDSKEESKIRLEVEEQKGFSDGHFNIGERIEGRLLNKKVVDVTFCWKFANGQETLANDLTKYFRVYRQSKQTSKDAISRFLAVTNTMMYVDKEVDLSDLETLSHRVETVAHNGTVLASLEIASIV